MSQLVYQCARQSAQEQRRGPSSETCGWRLQLCLLHLWLWVAALGLPEAIVWFSVGPLSPRPGGTDPLAPAATFLILAQAVLWQPFIPNPQGLYYRPVAWLCRLLSFFCVLFSPVRMYRAAPIIAVAHVALALQQLLSPQQLGHKAD
ncbi:hypothetical protein HPB50_029485 [Hyalomma asiaticum]|nr:hypothetical protein HPB50_029485 [Hyalomma asiaticum]